MYTLADLIAIHHNIKVIANITYFQDNIAQNKTKINQYVYVKSPEKFPC